MTRRWSFLLLAGTAIVLSPAQAGWLAPPDRPGPSPLLHRAAYSATVADIQRELARGGFDPGPADGFMGARTRASIEAYQRQNGLLVTGQPSESLLEHIRGAAQRAAAASSREAEDERQRVYRLQRSLSRMGYSVDATGAVDSQTEAAIRAYQRDERLLVDGRASEALLAHVRDNARGEARRGDPRRGGDDAIGTDTVAQIQVGLRERGYNVGNVAGRLDAATRDAIRAYQRDRRVAITGEPSPELASQLSEGLVSSDATPENIRAVQAALNSRGYTAGPADGVMGPATRDAIRAYRQRSGLAASSDVSKDLLVSLGLASEAGSSGTTTSASSMSQTTIVLSDDFDDGNLASRPAWRVLAKTFQVTDGALSSSVPVDAQPSRSDVGRNVLAGVLGEVLGMQLPQTSNSAAVAHAAAFANAFELAVRVRETGSAPAQFHIGPYEGTNAAHGYRLMYNAAAQQPLAILVGGDSASEIVGATSRAPALDDGSWHDVGFKRDADGRMTVTVDGATVLVALDNRITGTHDGVSMINGGGDWAVDSIEVTAAGSPPM